MINKILTVLLNNRLITPQLQVIPIQSTQKIYQFLLDEIYPDNIFLVDDPHGFVNYDSYLGYNKIWLNPIFSEKFTHNIVQISFLKLYPNIIRKLYKEKKIII